MFEGPGNWPFLFSGRIDNSFGVKLSVPGGLTAELSASNSVYDAGQQYGSETYANSQGIHKALARATLILNQEVEPCAEAGDDGQQENKYDHFQHGK